MKRDNHSGGIPTVIHWYARMTHDASVNNGLLRLAFVTGLFWFSLYPYVPVLAPFAVAKGASHPLVGIILGSYGLMQVLFRVPLGMFSDFVVNKLTFVRLGMAFAFISGLGMWLMPKPGALLFFRAVGGLAATTWVVYIIVFLNHFHEDELFKAMGYLNFLNAAGQALAMSLGGYLAQLFGTKIDFLLGAGAALVGLGISRHLNDGDSIKRQGVQLTELLQLLHNKKLLSVSVLAALSQLVAFATVFGFTPIEAKYIGVSDLVLGLMTTGYILSVALFSTLSGALIKRFGLRRSVVGGFLLVALTTAAIPFVQISFVLIILQIGSGIGQGVMFPPLMSLSVQHIDAGRRSTATGIFQGIIGLGIFAGPVVVGCVSGAAGLWWGFWIVALLTLIGAMGASKIVR